MKIIIVTVKFSFQIPDQYSLITKNQVSNSGDIPNI